MSKSKWFRVATEGATTDGREITRAEIEQIAASYSQQKYGARIWLEHYRGTVPGGPFDALGDVLAVEAREVDGGKKALFAQIAPLPTLIEMNKKGQKLFTSIEIHPSFPSTGGAYLFGLAVTDSPASLGTEVLKFSQTASVNPFAGRKSDKATLFTAAQEFQLELEADPATAETGMLAKALEKFTTAIEKFSTKPEPAKQPPAAPPPPTTSQHSTDLAPLVASLQAFAATTTAAVQKLEQQFAAQQQAHSALITQLSQQSADPHRPAATGGDGYEQAEF